MNELLEDEGIHVILTRSSDTYMKLKKRTDMANNAGVDLFVSIHCNYYEYDSQIRGFECYYREGEYDSMGYAESIVDYLEQTWSLCYARSARRRFFRAQKYNKPCSAY